MNPFASRTQKTIDIPFDLPNTVTIRKLAGRHLGRANQEFLNTLIAAVHARGGAKVQKDLEELFAKDPKKAANDIGEVKADPLNGYDKYFICAKGIVAWTYAESLSPIPPFDMKAKGLALAHRLDGGKERHIRIFFQKIAIDAGGQGLAQVLFAPVHT